MQFGFKITIIILQKSVCAAFYSQIRQATSVTECICTLCCCTLYVTLSVSLVFSSFGCGGGLWHHLIVIILLHMFYVLFWTPLKDVKRARETVRGDANGLLQILSEKKRIKQEYLAVAHWLLPTSNLLLPLFTSVWDTGVRSVVQRKTRLCYSQKVTVSTGVYFVIIQIPPSIDWTCSGAATAGVTVCCDVATTSEPLKSGFRRFVRDDAATWLKWVRHWQWVWLQLSS